MSEQMDHEEIIFATSTRPHTDWVKKCDHLKSTCAKSVILNYSSLFEEQYARLINALVENSHIVRLTIKDNYTNKTIEIIEAVLSNPRIQEFVIENVNLHDLVKVLKPYPHVRLSFSDLYLSEKYLDVYPELYLRCNSLTIRARKLSDLSYLPSLSAVHHFILPPWDEDELSNWLFRMTSLKSLDICGIRDGKTADKIASIIKDHPSLQEIILDSCERGEKIIRSRSFTSIIIMSDHNLSSRVIAAISEQRRLENFSLSLPYLSNTIFTASNVTDILRALSLSPLTRLSLRYVTLDKGSWTALALLERQGLEVLDILLETHREGVSSSMKPASQFLSSLTNLRNLTLYSGENVEDLIEIMQENRSLTYLEIGGKLVRHWDSISEVFKENTTLKCISFSSYYHDFSSDQVYNEHITGWSVDSQHNFPERIIRQIKTLVSLQYLQTVYPTYNRLSVEILFQIFRYLI